MAGITFSKIKDNSGKKLIRIAHTPAEEVQLRYDGWVEEPKSSAKPAAAAKDEPAPAKADK